MLYNERNRLDNPQRDFEAVIVHESVTLMKLITKNFSNKLE